MNSKIPALLAAGLLAGLGVTDAAQANAITNGGFETCNAATGAAAGWTYSQDTTIPRDNVNCVTQDTLLLSGHPTINPYDGTYMMEIKGEKDAAIEQVFYGEGAIKIKFAYSLAAFDFPATNDAADWFRVFVDGVQYFSDSLNAPVSTWVTRDWTTVQFYTAPLAAGQHTLQFCLDDFGTSNPGTFTCSGTNGGTNNPFIVAYIDSVFVPEPGTLALLGLGLAGLAALRCRRS